MEDKKIDSGATFIDSIEMIKVGGIDQWISLRAKDVRNPIILFLHGGPGTAQISFSRKPQRRLEEHFLVVNWDQRGAGRSFSKAVRKAEMTIERFVLDAEELVEALRQRFGQEKVFLVGHSWGSVIGARLAAGQPDMLRAYVGIGQVVDMKRGEELSYQFTLDEAERVGNDRALRQLRKIGGPPYRNLKSAGVQRKWLAKFHGATFEGTPIGMLFRNLSFKDTRPLDIVRFIRGAIFSLKCLEEQQTEVNFHRDLLKIDVPVFFCMGRKDYNTPSELVIAYLEKLQAPQKRLIWFERSAHSPNFEEPEAFCDFCISILKQSDAENNKSKGSRGIA